MRVTFALLLLAITSVAHADSLAVASPFQFRAGVGYDYLSQDFYQDSLVQSGVDSIFVSFLLHNEYMNDLKGILSARFAPQNKPFDVTLTYEQAHSQFRLTGVPNLRFLLDKTHVQINSEVEWRNASDDDLTSSKYLLGSSRIATSTPISGKLNFLLQGGFDGVNFTDQNETGVDYYRLNGRTGLSWQPSEMTTLETRLLAATRQVPDSERLEYRSFGADISLFSFADRSSLDLYGFAEYKDYRSEPDEDDLTHLELSGRYRLNISEAFFGSLEEDGQLDLFHKNDPVNSNVGRVKGALLGGWTDNHWTIAIGPEYEFLNEAGSSDGVEDYTEIGGRTDLELISEDRLFFSFSGSVGKRDLLHEDEVKTDFVYGRLSFIGDSRLLGHLHLNALTSIDKEWNEKPENSGTTYIVSSSLLYEF